MNGRTAAPPGRTAARTAAPAECIRAVSQRGCKESLAYLTSPLYPFWGYSTDYHPDVSQVHTADQADASEDLIGGIPEPSAKAADVVSNSTHTSTSLFIFEAPLRG